MIKSFTPIIDKDSNVLVLGSIPSITSLDKQEYYGFKHNRFWKIIAAYFQVELSTYDEKVNLLKKQKIALWDVIASCEREGSLDVNIKKEIPNDIEGILSAHPNIKYVLCNGKKSFALYQKYFGHLQVESFCLPSTSNANRSCKEEVLLATWFAHLDKRKTPFEY